MNVNYQLRVNELSIKDNGLKPGEFEIKPHFKRHIKENGNKTEITITVTLENCADAPFPVDIKMSFTGIFEFIDVSEESKAAFVNTQATQLMFPYIRSIISSSLSAAMMQPIFLPIVDVRTLFD